MADSVAHVMINPDKPLLTTPESGAPEAEHADGSERLDGADGSNRGEGGGSGSRDHDRDRHQGRDADRDRDHGQDRDRDRGRSQDRDRVHGHARYAGFSMPMLLALALVVGALVGVATDLLQTYLNSPWLSLVNSASPWLAPAFAVGAAARRHWQAAVAGVVVCVVELLAYDVTAHVRGIAVSSGLTVFWAVCGVIGGPLFGVGGRLWRRANGTARGLGLALLGSAFFSEAAVTYAVFLHYYSSAVLFVAIGVALIATLGLRGRQYARTGLWLLGTLPAAVLAELALHLVYRQTF
jgi:hypothetical protein